MVSPFFITFGFHLSRGSTTTRKLKYFDKLQENEIVLEIVSLLKQKLFMDKYTSQKLWMNLVARLVQ